jgi:hypothetical protein
LRWYRISRTAARHPESQGCVLIAGFWPKTDPNCPYCKPHLCCSQVAVVRHHHARLTLRRGRGRGRVRSGAFRWPNGHRP